MSHGIEGDIPVSTITRVPDSEDTQYDELAGSDEETPPPPPPPTRSKAKTDSRRRHRHNNTASSLSRQSHETLKDPDIPVPQLNDEHMDGNNPSASSQSIRNLNGTSSSIYAMTQPLNGPSDHFSLQANGGLSRGHSSGSVSSSSSQPAQFPDFMTTASTSHPQQESSLQGQLRPPPVGSPAGSKKGSSLPTPHLSNHNISNPNNSPAFSNSHHMNNNNNVSSSRRVVDVISLASQVFPGPRDNGNNAPEDGAHSMNDHDTNGQPHTSPRSQPTAPSSSASSRSHEDVETALVNSKDGASNKSMSRTRLSDIAAIESQPRGEVASDKEDEDDHQHCRSCFSF